MALAVCHRRSFGYRASLLALRAASSYSGFGYRVGGENRAQWKQQFNLRVSANTAEEIGCATTVSGWVCLCSQGVFRRCVPKGCSQGVSPRCVPTVCSQADRRGRDCLRSHAVCVPKMCSQGVLQACAFGLLVCPKCAPKVCSQGWFPACVLVFGGLLDLTLGSTLQDELVSLSFILLGIPSVSD